MRLQVAQDVQHIRIRVGLNKSNVVNGKTARRGTPAAASTVAGRLINSGTFNGLDSEEAKQAIIRHAEQQGFGRPMVTYRLRDWGVSRQRYWGAPIPNPRRVGRTETGWGGSVEASLTARDRIGPSEEEWLFRPLQGRLKDRRFSLLSEHW